MTKAEAAELHKRLAEWHENEARLMLRHPIARDAHLKMVDSLEEWERKLTQGHFGTSYGTPQVAAR